MPVQRYKLIIAYRGTRYHGWQAQPAMDNYKGDYKGDAPAPGEGIPTIQAEVTRALVSVVQHPVALVGSSRTDAGVHAKGQVAHFDTDQLQIPRDGLRRAANHRLPSDVLIRAVKPVPERFDAVKSTTTKRYQYFIWNHADRPVFFPDLAWHRWQRLDVEAMATAAAHFVGSHDFASFARPGHGRENTVRTVHACDVTYRCPKLVVGVEGSGFLWNMVRIMVGTLVEVGLGRYAPEDIPRMLAARDRQAAGSTAPPHGLYLQWVRFATPPTPVPASESRSVAESGVHPAVASSAESQSAGPEAFPLPDVSRDGS
jgi:tRNA pseudouridine38-40 synthase